MEGNDLIRLIGELNVDKLNDKQFDKLQSSLLMLQVKIDGRNKQEDGKQKIQDALKDFDKQMKKIVPLCEDKYYYDKSRFYEDKYSKRLVYHHLMSAKEYDDVNTEDCIQKRACTDMITFEFNYNKSEDSLSFEKCEDGECVIDLYADKGSLVRYDVRRNICGSYTEMSKEDFENTIRKLLDDIVIV